MASQLTADIPGGPDPAPAGQAAARAPDGILRILARRKFIVIGITALALIAAAIYILTATRRFSSTARLSVKLADARLTGASPAPTDADNFLANQQELITSGSVLAIVMQDPAVASLAALHEEPTSMASLRRIVGAGPGKRAGMLDVSAETKDPAEAPIIAQAVVDAYITYQTKPKESSIDNVLTALHKTRDDANAELTNAVLDMQELETKYGISPGGDANAPIVTRMSDLQKSLDAAETDLLGANADYEAARKSLPLPPPGSSALSPDNQADALLAATSDEGQLRQKLTALQAQLADLREHYLPNFPARQALERKVYQFAQLYVAAIGRRKALAQAWRDQLQHEYDAQRDLNNQLIAKTQRYKRLSAQSDDRRKVIEQLDGRIRAMELARDTGSVDITLIAPPTEATQSSPRKALALGAALLLGLLVGCGAALGRDRLDDRLHNAQDVRAGLGVKLLGVVPQMPTGISPAVAAQKVALDPASEVAESYRTIRTALYFAAPKDRSKTILVTSPAPGDGKTTSAANLAIAMTQAGKRVILVDADLRHPQQHSIFSVRDRVGLASLLGGNGTLDQAIQATSIDNLDLLAAGPPPRNPSELLNSGSFVELLETLAERYDQVVIDAPPVMGLADARIIAASCDLTVMVLRAQKSTRKRATLARDGLLGVGARLLGIIVNDVPKANDDYSDSNFGYPVGGRDAGARQRLIADADPLRSLPQTTLRRPG